MTATITNILQPGIDREKAKLLASTDAMWNRLDEAQQDFFLDFVCSLRLANQNAKLSQIAANDT